MFFLILILTLLVVIPTHDALAIPPPDFLFSIGSQLVQIFLISFAFLWFIVGATYQFAKIHFANIQHKKLFWASIFLIILVVSFTGAFIYNRYHQNNLYNKWVREINIQKQNTITPKSLENNTEPPFENSPSIIIDEDTDLLPSTLPEASPSSDNFFTTNANLRLFVTNQEFKNIIAVDQPFVLDAREDEEYEYGHFPDSAHIRFADLKDGQWDTLPINRVIYVFCWSGIRGKEVAEFLRSKKIVAQYVEKGADDWVSFGGTWTGEIKFAAKYPEQRYQIVFTTDQVKNYINEGIVIVDSRPSEKYTSWHIPNSINIPVIYTPSNKMESVLNQVPSNSKIITICDDFVSCFDARIGGVKLERKGHTFLGRYNKPWDYRNKYK